MIEFPSVEKGTQFAKRVVSGKRPACRYVVLACQRHLDDLANNDLPYAFSEEEAERRLKIIQSFPHVKGEWAHKRQLITLEPWQCFGIMVMFGWLNKATGFRRYREAYWEVPRKNGKSIIAAGVALNMFFADREAGSEVYSGATTEAQAWEVFRPARLMVDRTPMLKDAAGITAHAKSLTRSADGSRFEPGDGSSPSCAIVDEYHEHPDASLYETMATGMGSRRQPIIFIITTAGSSIEGPCYDKRRQVIEMLEGTTPDQELFGWIWTIDQDDDWTDPKVLQKANPNCGVSVYQDYLESQQNRAINNARFTNIFKTKHLNVWTSSKAGFFNIQSWNACADNLLTLESFEGQNTTLGADLARKLDLNCLARIFTRDIEGKRHYYSVAPLFWVPEDTVFKSDNRRMADRYQKWHASGDLIATDGAEVDYREILETAKEINLLTPVDCIPIDPHGATNLSHQLDDEGLNPITVTQNYSNLSDPMKELEAAISAGRFHHDGNPIMTWCISNVVGKNIPGNDDVVRPVKEATENKIDGAVALIMAIGRAMLNESTESIYESEELLIL